MLDVLLDFLIQRVEIGIYEDDIVLVECSDQSQSELLPARVGGGWVLQRDLQAMKTHQKASDFLVLHAGVQVQRGYY